MSRTMKTNSPSRSGLAGSAGDLRAERSAVLLLSGALSARNIKTPRLTPPAYKESAPAAYSAAPPGTWQPAKPQDALLKGKWWEIFNEPELNALEDQLNINNQNIAQFFQNFMAARAQIREARAGLFPTVTVDPAYSRTTEPAALRAVAAVTATARRPRFSPRRKPSPSPAFLCRSMSRGSRTSGAAFATRFTNSSMPRR